MNSLQTFTPMPQGAVPGSLFYLMGPSGSGKDSLLRTLRDGLGASDPVLVAHRYITRDSDSHEASVSLTPAEFARRSALGCFALQWHSHGLHYGIGIEIETWMARGISVVLNGSREHLGEAHARYPHLHAVHVQVHRNVLETRLAQRGREAGEAVAARLARATRPFAVPTGCRLTEIDNSGPLDRAATALLALVRPPLAA